MLRHYLVLLVCLFICGCVCSKVRVCFTPGEKCTQQIIDAIDRSKRSILVQAFEFTSRPIAKSLIRAKKRGIDVKVILDKSQIESRY
ncbi:MAG: phospholipase D-like domain-containing protein [Wolbachia endosymbiont of Tyrophagus putrescentiae]|nr:phospholipase D-like domain-containing protein [Wolbachia endosymbiont of Tyrophagus putrescentiae]